MTPQEAALPSPAEKSVATRAITRGPTVRFVAPGTAPVAAGESFLFRLEFAARGGARPDPATLKVRYIRASPVDVTPRLRPFLKDDVLEIREAGLPPGEHQFQVDIQDDQGREGTTTIVIRVP